MNIRRKNGKTLNKAGLRKNTLLGRVEKIRLAFTTRSNRTSAIPSYLFDENSRKSVETACLEAERRRAEAYRMRLNLY